MKVNRHIICLCYNHFYHLYLVALNKNMNCDRPKDKLVMKNKSKRLIEQISNITYTCQNYRVKTICKLATTIIDYVVSNK